MARKGYLTLRLTPERENRISTLAHLLKLELPQPRPENPSYRLTEDRRELIGQIASRLNLSEDATTSVIDFALNLAIYHSTRFNAFASQVDSNIRADEFVIDLALAWAAAED